MAVDYIEFYSHVSGLKQTTKMTHHHSCEEMYHSGIVVDTLKHLGKGPEHSP